MASTADSKIIENRVPVLIFANKQDLEPKVAMHEIPALLDFPGMEKRDWFIQPCNALQGLGLQEGLQWLRRAMNVRARIGPDVARPLQTDLTNSLLERLDGLEVEIPTGVRTIILAYCDFLFGSI